MVTVVKKNTLFLFISDKSLSILTLQQRKCINNAKYNDKHSKNFVK